MKIHCLRKTEWWHYVVLIGMLCCAWSSLTFAQVAAAQSVNSWKTESLNIPDVVLQDQNGREVHFYRDLVAGKTVAINFIFTTCTTICPPLGATFAKTHDLLGARAGKEIRLISISVDPVGDTSARLKSWNEKFGARSGWSLVTGDKPAVDKLLKALGAYSAQKEDHTPLVLVGNAETNAWTRVYGLAQPAQLVSTINEMARVVPAKAEQSSSNAQSEQAAAQKYFSDVALIDQNGERHRFYSDLLKNKTVIVNSFFTTCTSICPPMAQRLGKIQEALGDRLGKEVFILSISVDPVKDRPEKLKTYAEQFKAKPGWYFLTGKKENVDWALYKLGQYVEAKDDHTSVMIVGNEAKGVWKKVFGMGKVEELIKVVEETLHAK